MEQITCKLCGKELVGKQRIFCGRKCRDKDFKQRNREKLRLKAEEYRNKNKDLIAKRAKEARNKEPERFKKYSRNNYYRHKEKYNKYSREYLKKHRENHNARQQQYRKDNPEKVIARRKARKIVIATEAKCQDCCSKTNLEKHHEDYSKPEEIVLLCTVCHSARHRKYEVE